jgi:hypothetical protein
MRDLAKLQYNMWWLKAPLDEFFNTIGSDPAFAALVASGRFGIRRHSLHRA